MSLETVSQQLFIIHSILSFSTKSFKQIGILHAFTLNLLAVHWIKRGKVNRTLCWMQLEIIPSRSLVIVSIKMAIPDLGPKEI